MAKRATSRRVKTGPVESVGGTRTWLVIGAVAVAVIALGALLYVNIRGEAPIRGLVTFPRPSRGHDDQIEFQSEGLPPAGGVHHSTWQNCGIYTEPIEEGNAAHSMEHGAVWITYQPDLNEDDVNRLQELVRGQNYLLLSPYPGLRSPVVLTAWGLQLEVDSVNDGRIVDFIDRYQQGPQTPERGATCRDGVGVPIQ